MESEFVYKLKKPFDYSFKGETLTAKNLVLSAPSFSNRKECFIIENGFMKITRELQKSQPVKTAPSPKKLENILAEDFVAVFMSGDTDPGPYFDAFESLLLSGVCMVDGKEVITDGLMKKLLLEDFKAVFGQYLKFFLLHSL